MESTKEMKNIKPAYAVRLGTGVFVGTDWQCIKCGLIIAAWDSVPAGLAGGKCPSTPTGNHIWKKR